MEMLKTINDFVKDYQFIISAIVGFLGVVATSSAAIIALRLGSFKRKIKMKVLCLKAVNKINGKMYFALEICNVGERNIDIMPSSFGIKAKCSCGFQLPLLDYPDTYLNHFDVVLTVSPLKKELLYCIEDEQFQKMVSTGLEGATQAKDLFVFYDSPLRERKLYKIKNKAILNWLDKELFNKKSTQKQFKIPFTDTLVVIKNKSTKYVGD